MASQRDEQNPSQDPNKKVPDEQAASKKHSVEGDFPDFSLDQPDDEILELEPEHLLEGGSGAKPPAEDISEAPSEVLELSEAHVVDDSADKTEQVLDVLPTENDADKQPSSVIHAEVLSDEDIVAEAEPVSDVFTAGFLSDEPAEKQEPAKAQAGDATAPETPPTSDVFAAEFLHDRPAEKQPSSVIEAEEIETEAAPASDVFATEFLDEKPADKQPSSVIEAEVIDEAEESVPAIPAEEQPSSVVEAEVVEEVEEHAKEAPASDIFGSEFLQEKPAEKQPSSVVEAEVVEEAEERVEATPASDIFDTEFLQDRPSEKQPSSVIEADAAVEDAEESPGSDVLSAEPVEPPMAEKQPSSVVEAEALEEEAEPASGVMAADHGAPITGVQPASNVFALEQEESSAGTTPASDVFAAGFLEDQPESKEASAIVPAETTAHAEEEQIAEAAPASDIFSTEFLEGDGAEKQPSSVIEAEEVAEEDLVSETDSGPAEGVSPAITESPSEVFATGFLQGAVGENAPTSDAACAETHEPALEAPSSDVFAAGFLHDQPASGSAVIPPETPPSTVQPPDALLHQAPKPGTAVHPAEVPQPSSAIVPRMEETIDITSGLHGYPAKQPSAIIPPVHSEAPETIGKHDESSHEPEPAALEEPHATDDSSSSVLDLDLTDAEAKAEEPSAAGASAAEEVDEDVLGDVETSNDESQSHIFTDFTSEVMLDDRTKHKHRPSGLDILRGASSIFSFDDDDDLPAPRPRIRSKPAKTSKPVEEDDQVLSGVTDKTSEKPSEAALPSDATPPVLEDDALLELAQAEAASSAAKPVSDVIEAAEIDEADEDVIAFAEAEDAEEAVEVVDDDEEIVTAEAESDVLEAEEVLEDDDIIEAEAESDAVIAEAAEDDDVIAEAVEADEFEEETPRKPLRGAKRPKEPSVEWEELPAGEEVAEAAEAVDWESVEADDIDRTISFDDSHHADLGQATESIALDSGPDSAVVDLGTLPPMEDERPSGIDRLAEALESGMDLKKKRPKKPKPAEEEASEEIDIDFNDVSSQASKKNLLEGTDLEDDIIADAEEDEVIAEAAEDDEEIIAEADEDEEIIAEAEADEEEPPAPKKKGKKAAAATDEEAEDLALSTLMSEDEEEPVVVPKKKGKAAKAVEFDSEEEEDEAPAPVRKKARRAAVAVEEDEEGGGTAVLTRKPPKPKYGRRWLGGMLLGWLLIGGVAGGLWYIQPSLLDDGLAEGQKLVQQSPNAVKKPAPGAEERKKLEAQIAAAKTEMEKVQSEKEEESKKLASEVMIRKEAEKTTKGIFDVLVKNKVVDADADAKDLSKSLASALKSKKDAEKQVDTVAKALVTNKLLEDKEKFDVGEFEKVLKDLAENKTAMENVNKLLEKAELKDAGDKGVEKLVTAYKDIEGKLGDVNKLLADAKLKDEGAKGVRDLLDARAALEKDRDSLESTLNTIFKELVDANAANPEGDPRKQVVGGLKQIRLKAENPLALPMTSLAAGLRSFGTGSAQLIEKGLENATLLAELAYYHTREPLIQSPAEKVDATLSHLQNKSDPTQVKAAMREAAYLLTEEAKANQQTRAKAHYVTGLGQRQLENFDAARKSFEKAIAEAGGAKSDWLPQVKQALAELSDARVYFLPRIDQLRAEGNFKAAQEELAVGLKALPNDPNLLTRRGFVALEMARHQSDGRIKKDVQKAIRDDAQQALKSEEAAGEAAFLLAQLEEDLGNFNAAEAMYRRALKTSKGSAEELTRIRVALARLLQRERPMGVQQAPVPEPPPQEEPKEEKKKPAVSYVHPLTQMLTVLAIGAQPGLEEDEDPIVTGRIKESIDIAKELMQSNNPKIKGQGHMLLGQAYAKQGKRTEGLREYIEGLKLLFPGRATSELSTMVEEHPLFHQPDTLTRPNPDLAEHHYGQGLQFYWGKNYPEAEAHFKQAATFFDQDARYFYFLGLAQLAQNTKLKRDAADLSFSRGAKLEAQNRPAFATINTALERIQGPLRLFLNRYRAVGALTKIE